MNALGIYSQDGDRLTTMDFRWNVPQERYQLMLQDWLKLPAGERKPVFLKDSISMIVYDSSSGLLFVAYTLDNLQPLQVIESLKAITTFLHSAFGGLSEEKVRGNLHMVSELINECIDYGIVTQLQLHVVLERIHSKYLAPKRSLLQLMRNAGYRSGQFRSILPTENSGAQEVYVDLIEVVSCVVSSSGITMLALCQGTLQMKSYMSVEGLSSVLKVSNFNCSELAPQFPFMQGGAPIHCFLEDMQLHQDAELLDTLDDNGYCQLKAPALRGEYVLMTYSVDLVKQGQFVPPVSASVVCECDQEYNKKVNLTVMLTNNILHRGVQHLSLELPLPRFVDRVSCSCKFDERMATFVSEYDPVRGVLHAKLRTRNPKPSKAEFVLKGGASLQISIKAMLRRPYDANMFSRGLGPANLSYQMQSVSVSGMKVCYLDFLDSSGLKYVNPNKEIAGPGKWLRTVTTSTATTFRV
eukprot:jgi/Ulvmu1/5101/UM021_0118.1